MKHFFCLHSNICVITSLSLIEKLLSMNEEVIILLTRKCTFDYYKGEVEIYDLQNEFAGMQTMLGSLLSLRTFSTIFQYKRYLAILKEYLNRIINNEEYVFYTPNFGTSVAPILEDNQLCKGYYFLEEGTMSYLEYKWLEEKWFSKKTKIANVVRGLFGIRSFFQLTTTSRFKGTIALSPHCFPWNKKERVVVSSESYIKQTKAPCKSYKGIILIGYYEYDLQLVEQALIIARSALKMSINNDCDIAIKIHPHTYSYSSNYACLLEELIKSSFPEITILPISYSVELSIMKFNTCIVSVFGLSSLSLYSILLKSLPTFNIEYVKGRIESEEIDSLEDYMKAVYD